MRFAFITIALACFTNLFSSAYTTESVKEKYRRIITLKIENQVPEKLCGMLEIKITSANGPIYLTKYNLDLPNKTIGCYTISLGFDPSGTATITAEFRGNIVAQTLPRVFATEDLYGLKVLAAPTSNLLPWNNIGIVPNEANTHAIGITPTSNSECTKLIPTERVG